MRTSTAVLAVAFAGVLLLWYGVRPDPETVTEEVVRVTRTVEKQKPAKERAAEEEVDRPRTSTTPTPTATPKPTRTPAPARVAPSATATPSAPNLFGPAPSAEATEPGETPPPARGGGLFGSIRPRNEKPAPSTDSPTTAEPRG